jgi:hypothetical protein
MHKNTYIKTLSMQILYSKKVRKVIFVDTVVIYCIFKGKENIFKKTFN